MQLADLLRLHMYVPQHKALHCYIVLSVWILLLIGGVYKFLEPRQKSAEPTVASDLFVNLAVDVKTKKIFKLCNEPEDIVIDDEGIAEPQRWVLKGLIILIRHGDRGPLQHVKNISFVNCGNKLKSPLLNNYKAYLHNATVAGKVSWIGPGAFHGFPLLPTHPTQCQLGQLTMQGVHQLLKLGKMLKERYVKFWPKLATLNSSDITVYSTRYRRTFQSALAFLYSLLPQETLAKINILESQSMNFCFKDCGCPITDKYFNLVQKAVSHQLKSHPAVALLAEATSKSVFPQNAEYGSSTSDPQVVRDALLTYVCHGSSLPCETPFNCVRRQNVAGIFAYTDWVNYQKWRNRSWQKFCLLKSYGLIKHIVQQMLKTVSSDNPSFVLYSGHDHTVEQLSAALGLANDPLLLRYAARLVFEVYQNLEESPHNGAAVVYFRLLANGRDVTNQIGFCKQLVVQNTSEVLCKIEDIVRFLHDDYFSSLNSTNFKEACSVRK